MLQLTKIEKAILRSLNEAGGEINSLWKLANELEIDYSHAHQRANVLEILGIIVIERCRGRPLLLKLVTDDAAIPAEADSASISRASTADEDGEDDQLIQALSHASPA
jgi:hypothetical protein